MGTNIGGILWTCAECAEKPEPPKCAECGGPANYATPPPDNTPLCIPCADKRARIAWLKANVRKGDRVEVPGGGFLLPVARVTANGPILGDDKPNDNPDVFWENVAAVYRRVDEEKPR